MEEPGDLSTLKSVLADNSLAADQLGLLFHSGLSDPAYEQTPRNTLTFASTGGDGVHFGYLVMAGGVGDDDPIVMTVPSAEKPNRVVGRNLRHFLGLGRRSGYFVLEQLQYDFAGTVAALDRRDLSFPDEIERAALDAIAQSLGVVDWHDHAAVLASLESEFAASLDV